MVCNTTVTSLRSRLSLSLLLPLYASTCFLGPNFARLLDLFDFLPYVVGTRGPNFTGAQGGRATRRGLGGSFRKMY